MADAAAMKRYSCPSAIDAAKVIVLAMTDATQGGRMTTTGAVHAISGEPARSRREGPSLRQPVFNWLIKYKYTEVKHFEWK